jgi:hypothetical protein
MISKTSFCYKERVSRVAWLGAFFGAFFGVFGGGLALYPVALAQDEPEVEIITEPPAESEPEPAEPPQLETPPPAEPPAEAPAPKVEPPKEQPGQLRVGGGIGFGIGTGFISVGIAPQVSYIFKRIVEPGVSMRYQYSKDRIAIPDVVWHTYGGSLFVRLFPIRQLFVLVEGEIINTGWKTGGISSGRRNYGNLLLGGGYMIGVGKGAFMGLSLKFAVLRNPFYPTAFPIISFGAGYAF